MKTLDLDALPWYTKQQIAEHQLDRAIRLLLDEHDAVSSLTLAGASEEILGKLVEQRGGRSSLASFIDDCLMIGRLGHGEEWKHATFADMANFTRNGLKHLGDGTEIVVTEDTACEMLDRAMENLLRLDSAPSEQVRRYVGFRYSRC